MGGVCASPKDDTQGDPVTSPSKDGHVLRSGDSLHDRVEHGVVDPGMQAAAGTGDGRTAGGGGDGGRNTGSRGATGMIRGAVSKKKRRFQEDGFDLDLSYVLPNLIAMGFPSSGVEGLYRNPVDQVVAFFDARHSDDGGRTPLYKIYNLCAERDYDPGVFHNSVCIYPFEDHNPPPLTMVRTICDDIHEWLSSDPRHVAAVHCKAGKGRTGMVICAYLLHCGAATTAEESQAQYAGQRTLDGKGVTIPSQQRYIGFYARQLAAARDAALRANPPAWLRGGDPRFVPTPARYARRLSLSHLPRNSGAAAALYFKV
eukprot:CAMPEP_0203810404 /NCGR_PEP_ID=MMETSP0115-20131106/2931_1 /ASSEMBLY_ACC=CAM_ASM_000227 /TAXON_ID=33651 /ORGANISM="Bicosoecid sp, Strain ms1" /LENGTH=313 /DNA_ID=CAMNT_0050719201 /DNA_START=1 /DNA_END=939 /DNA_ORIENTATION=+